MTYSEKLLDPRWQRKRLKILERDNFTCQDCYDASNTLHVHHLHYENGRDPWDYPNEWLITLCKDCHEDITEFRKKVDSEIIKFVHLNFKDTFNLTCLHDVFSKYKDIQGLMYLLWEMLEYQDDIDTVLCNYWNGKKKEFYVSICEPSDKTCMACGEKMGKLKDILYLCKTCGWETPVEK